MDEMPDEEAQTTPPEEMAVDDPTGEDGITLSDIADALDEFIQHPDMDPEMAQDLAQARDLIDKHSSRPDEGAEEQEDTEAAPPTEGNGEIG